MELKAKVNKIGFIRHYISIFNGGLKLTDKEQDYLVVILDKYLTLQARGLAEPFISTVLFDKVSMKAIREEMKLSPQSMNNYKSQLKAKGVFRDTPSGLSINPKLIPQKTLTFKFEVI